MSLTEKQARFVSEYLIDLNATQAAIRAGYSADTAEQIGYQLLQKTSVADAIAAGSKKLTDKLNITADRVLGAIALVAFSDVRKMFGPDGALLRPGAWDEETAAAVAALDVVTVSRGEGAVEHIAKVKRADRLRALDMLARHLSLYNDKLEVKHPLDGLAERLERGRRRFEGLPDD
jgi:phage terminase small subunit